MLRPSAIVPSVVLVLIGAAVAYSSTSSSLGIAPDESPSLDEYRALGVPDPSRPWNAEDYLEALRTLGSLPRRQLPRAAGPSKPMFDRLLISFRSGFELPGGDTPSSGSRVDQLPENLPSLYSPRESDGLLFDLELVAIRTEAVSRTLDLVQDRSDLLETAQSFAGRAQAAPSEAQQERFSEGARRAERVAHRTSRMARDLVSDALRLYAIPHMRESARDLLLERLEEIVPRLPGFLASRGSRWIAHMLKGAAATEANAPIREELLDLANEMESDLEDELEFSKEMDRVIDDLEKTR